jgi:ribosomal protein L40E
MARTRTTKAVAQRIDLNYFKRPTPFKRMKLWLAILAPAIALVWIGWHVLGRDNRVYSSGRLSAAHAVLEKECAACHVRQAGGFSAAATDSACLACHDGPAHHASNINAKVACAECHVEHRGRVDLAATKSQSCAQCHGDLPAANQDSKYAKHIRSLEDGHPEFAALRSVAGTPATDSGTIKLNHALHMRSIRRGPSGPMVQLDCENCHAPGAAGSDLTYSDARYRAASVSYKDRDPVLQIDRDTLKRARPITGRELMAPPKFANACAGCHLLTFDTRFEKGAPHDTPEIIHVFLAKKFSDYITSHAAELNEVHDPRRSLTGRVNGPASRSISQTQWVAEHVAVSEELLWHKTCSQCHAVSGTTLQDVKIARWEAANSQDSSRVGSPDSNKIVPLPASSLPKIAQANITLQWLPHARFDHDAHRGFSCSGCHQNALTSTEASDILIPGIATCQRCHAQGPDHAESRCFECHTYHDWAKRKEVKPTFTLPGLRSTGK